MPVPVPVPVPALLRISQNNATENNKRWGLMVSVTEIEVGEASVANSFEHCRQSFNYQILINELK